MPIFNSDAISKSDLDHDVVRAVVEHYRHSEGKIRIASMQGALFVLKWQEAEKLSGEALARYAIDGVPRLQGAVEQCCACSDETNPPPYVWDLLERLANTAIRPPGCSEEEHATSLEADVAAARELLAAYRATT